MFEIKKIVLLLSVAFIIACSKNSDDDLTDSVKLAKKIKERSEMRDSLIQLGAEAYAIKLIAECRQDQIKCAEAADAAIAQGRITEIMRIEDSYVSMCDSPAVKTNKR